MNCPKCGFTLDDATLARSLASKGGKAGVGAAKARSSEQMRAAARVRWGHYAACNHWDGKACNCEQLKTLAKGLKWDFSKGAAIPPTSQKPI